MHILSSRKRRPLTQTEKTKKILFSLFLNEMCAVARFYKYRDFFIQLNLSTRATLGTGESGRCREL